MTPDYPFGLETGMKWYARGYSYQSDALIQSQNITTKFISEHEGWVYITLQRDVYDHISNATYTTSDNLNIYAPDFAIAEIQEYFLGPLVCTVDWVHNIWQWNAVKTYFEDQLNSTDHQFSEPLNQTRVVNIIDDDVEEEQTLATYQFSLFRPESDILHNWIYSSQHGILLAHEWSHGDLYGNWNVHTIEYKSDPTTPTTPEPPVDLYPYIAAAIIIIIIVVAYFYIKRESEKEEKIAQEAIRWRDSGKR